MEKVHGFGCRFKFAEKVDAVQKSMGFDEFWKALGSLEGAGGGVVEMGGWERIRADPKKQGWVQFFGCKTWARVKHVQKVRALVDEFAEAPRGEKRFERKAGIKARLGLRGDGGDMAREGPLIDGKVDPSAEIGRGQVHLFAQSHLGACAKPCMGMRRWNFAGKPQGFMVMACGIQISLDGDRGVNKSKRSAKGLGLPLIAGKPQVREARAGKGEGAVVSFGQESLGEACQIIPNRLGRLRGRLDGARADKGRLDAGSQLMDARKRWSAAHF